MTNSIIFLIIEMQSDIALTTFIISKFVKNQSCQYIKVMKIIFKYLKKSRDWGIIYKKRKKICIKSYLDLD